MRDPARERGQREDDWSSHDHATCRECRLSGYYCERPVSALLTLVIVLQLDYTCGGV